VAETLNDDLEAPVLVAVDANESEWIAPRWITFVRSQDEGSLALWSGGAPLMLELPPEDLAERLSPALGCRAEPAPRPV